MEPSSVDSVDGGYEKTVSSKLVALKTTSQPNQQSQKNLTSALAQDGTQPLGHNLCNKIKSTST